MGNWRTVNIIGTVDENDVPALKKACYTDKHTYDNYHCLTESPGIGGLGRWIKPTINARGNLAERDYTVADVARQLQQLVAVAPSLTVKVHCGDDYEEPKCICTITVAHGRVTISAPERITVDPPSENDMRANIFDSLHGAYN